MSQFLRSQMLYGQNIAKIYQSKVLVVGAGGVGGSAIEALARAGLGTIGVCDGDAFDISNLNRQILATHHTIGMRKTAVAKQRILSINPQCNVIEYDFFYDESTKERIELGFDYVADCIDNVNSKLLLIKTCKEQHIPIISAMGAGNRLDPSALLVCDIYKTQGCPLAKIMRSKLKKLDITHLDVVSSTETPTTPAQIHAKKPTVGSTPTVPPAAGLLLANHIIQAILNS